MSAVITSFAVKERTAEEDSCLCGHVNIKTGTWLIAIFEIIDVVLGLYFVCTQSSPDDHRLANTPLSVILIGSMLWLAFTVLLAFGLYKDKAELVLPHMVWTILSVFGLVINSPSMIFSGGFKYLITTIFIILFLLFSLYIEWRCYKYMRAVRKS